MIPDEKLSLFKGANHRFATLGHDPILGLIFGTGNIMTNTITCVKTPAFLSGIPVLTTNHVVYTSDFKDPRIATYGSTSVMLQQAAERTKDQPGAFVASLIKQLDIGGLIVTVQRRIYDTEYIRRIKEEFVFGGFNKKIQGDGLEDISWD